MNTGLDYAANRHYDPQQGRFTQVDPIGMNASSLASPQTLNLYAYCTNDPINEQSKDAKSTKESDDVVQGGILASVTIAIQPELIPIELGSLSGFAGGALIAGGLLSIAIGLVYGVPPGALTLTTPGTGPNTATNSNTATRDRTLPTGRGNKWTCFACSCKKRAGHSWNHAHGDWRWTRIN